LLYACTARPDSDMLLNIHGQPVRITKNPPFKSEAEYSIEKQSCVGFAGDYARQGETGEAFTGCMLRFDNIVQIGNIILDRATARSAYSSPQPSYASPFPSSSPQQMQPPLESPSPSGPAIAAQPRTYISPLPDHETPHGLHLTSEQKQAAEKVVLKCVAYWVIYEKRQGTKTVIEMQGCSKRRGHNLHCEILRLWEPSNSRENRNRLPSIERVRRNHAGMHVKTLFRNA
jgi:hypothetical protein